MAFLRNGPRKPVDIGEASPAFQAGKLHTYFTDPDGKAMTLILTEEETERMYKFLTGCRSRREQAILREEAIARGETVALVQRFVDENGEPRYLVGGEIDDTKTNENGLISVTATTRPVGETNGE